MNAKAHLPSRDALFRHRFLFFLTTLLLLLALYPFLEQDVSQRLLSLFFTGTLIAGTYAVSRKPRFLVAAIVIAVGAFSSQWTSHFINSRIVFMSSRCLGFLFYLLITVAILANVLKGEMVTADKIFGAICAYLVMGLTWGYLFGLIEIVHPGSFLENGLLIAPGRGRSDQFALINSMIYYSMATLTTTTFGDILPKTTPARAMSNLEAIAGQMYVAVVISRLVALHITHSIAGHGHTKD
ncbi:MAG TPA: ion channel [Verrucomicrobiae bacterium]|nr:ion channel [Verrucomicrobiae bacterium]